MKRIALAVLMDPQNRILLQHKSADAPNNPNMWCLFGGAIEADESPEAAVRREMQEELEVSLGALNLLGQLTDVEKGIDRFYFSASTELPAETLKRQQHEGDNLGFFSLAEMADLSMNPAHRAALFGFLSVPRHGVS